MTTSAVITPSALRATPAVRPNRSFGKKLADLFEVLSVSLEMARIVGQSGRVTAPQVKEVRAMATRL